MDKFSIETNIAHEMRSPVSTAAAMIKMLLSMETDNKKIQFLEAANRNCDYALRMVEDILDLNRGRLKTREDEIDIASLVQGLESEYSASASRREIRFQCNLDPSAPKIITGDRDRIEQILRNLLDNALKFTKPKSEITLWATERRGSSGIVFSVIDQAAVIPETRYKDIFNNGSRLNDTGTPGLGIGLALCKKISDLIGGEIHVKPAGGKYGNEFSLELKEG